MLTPQFILRTGESTLSVGKMDSLGGHSMFTNGAKAFPVFVFVFTEIFLQYNISFSHLHKREPVFKVLTNDSQ